MFSDYEKISKSLKVISDPKRLEILDMLSCGELCACEILEKFDITQPTLSHDMKKLESADLIKSRKIGKNTYYSLKTENLDKLTKILDLIFSRKENCICHIDNN
ncbi:MULTISPECIES: metalloregulator ArsR/SmtB family transcription factor [Anaerococcus]|jgi:codY helix-turn-helix domain|uniref:Transcriptional regulator n=1 Tax=Anaerococcus octavius TaxID=54007 RepID=A0A2I1M9D9_9FIRM|nr:MULTISPECIES: metalloregulator ArsR/SmtB family transcription factor [Anaerococcus]MBS6106694.1 winged helix-turn-helix transcriptional regulator [Anaerococcus sp.]MDU0894974.1 metalloregulator ArsR/SmtB family transcription factor [Anaerococcus sp.]MDU2598264.1 metalloregulator ArsR/SmtB family transcription factor [Anaerococcus sp.]MDU3177176.1 metalloregulator ArsR/SmtB family transcription factor [Anaerococcus sp.]MDU4025582.1 metalloregulator ArsR/SmtB family transcription factor [Anae